jgi:hypothetical protein
MVELGSQYRNRQETSDKKASRANLSPQFHAQVNNIFDFGSNSHDRSFKKKIEEGAMDPFEELERLALVVEGE